MKKKEAVGELQSQGPVSLSFEGINLNVLARTISKYEGLKKSVNIAQIKEVLRITIQLLSNNFQVSEVVRLLERERIRLTYDDSLWPFDLSDWSEEPFVGSSPKKARTASRVGQRGVVLKAKKKR